MPIIEICPQDSCTGCLACYNICPVSAIQIKYSKEGFLFPTINENICISCGVCIETCPSLKQVDIHKSSPDTYAAWSRNKKILLESSSGGVFSEIANYTISRGGVVYGACFTDNWTVEHKRIEDIDSLSCLRGSKYVQSNIGHCLSLIKEDLLNETLVLFTGTPCQVAGLYAFLKSVRYDKSKLITIDLVCHGVPSSKFFKDYIHYLEDKRNCSISQYKFRDKKWSWFRFNTKAIYSDGRTYYGTWEGDPFMRGFLRDLCLRKSCYSCRFANKNRLGDFTLCDYWGYNKEVGERDNKDFGVSLVLVHTINAKLIWDEIKPQLFCYSRDFEDSIKSNPAFHKPFPLPAISPQFWSDYDDLSFANLVEKYCYSEPIPRLIARKYKYGRKIDRIIKFGGTIKRKISGTIFNSKLLRRKH